MHSVLSVGWLATVGTQRYGVLAFSRGMYRRLQADGGRKKKIRVAVSILGGELCQHGSGCDLNEQAYIFIDCPCCNGFGCEHCEDGRFKLTQCGIEYVGPEIWEAIRAASVAEHHLPKAGGTMDQSKWFVDVWIAFSNEKSKLESEQLRKSMNG